VRAFRRRGEQYVATFTPEEARMLVQLCSQVAELMGTHAASRKDPAVIRLLPDAYRENPEAATEFRRFTAASLAERKVANARLMISGLAEAAASPKPLRVALNPLDAQGWIRGITDIRLSIAARLDITSDEVELPAGEPLVEIYQWLTFVHESLVIVLR